MNDETIRLIELQRQQITRCEKARTETLDKLADGVWVGIQYYIHERADYTARIAGLQTAVEELTEERDAQKQRGDNFWQMYRTAANMLETEREQRQDLERIMDQLCDRLEELA